MVPDSTAGDCGSVRVFTDGDVLPDDRGTASVADIFAHGVERLVSGLAQDGKFGGAIEIPLCHKFRPQAMSSVEGRVKASGSRCSLKDAGDETGIEAPFRNSLVAVDSAEHRPAGVPGCGEPSAVTVDRAGGSGRGKRKSDAGSLPFRVSLRARDPDDEPILSSLTCSTGWQRARIAGTRPRTRSTTTPGPGNPLGCPACVSSIFLVSGVKTGVSGVFSAFGLRVYRIPPEPLLEILVILEFHLGRYPALFLARRP